MSAGAKVAVSKRSARQFSDSEDGVEKMQQPRLNKFDDMALNGGERKSSTSTSTSHSSQASIEPSPVVHAADPDQVVEKLLLVNQERRASIPEVRDAFHPSSETDLDDVTVSAQEFEKSLPKEGRPSNFGIVVPGVYRSSFPQTEDYAFIESLKLKTIVTLVQKEFPQGYDAFIKKNGINHCVFDMKGTKKEEIPIKTMKSILRLVLDRRNHPLLIHCNHGKHRTGCVVAIVRKLSGWDLGNVLEEYRAYAEPKIRDCDVKYITGFEPADISNLFREAGWRFRTPGFVRAVIFAFVMLVVWLFSGNKLLPEQPKRQFLKE
ncbi:putative tyrosine-protein phosphatase [Podospora fimiseda]|uniref:diphosphoinositol-polyphosphate diphosphatase n=1 Tax=Podospora fimiseda TaxID=252190 RepID=A0AAN7BSY8_9PEZI|nr:putative tyrosine-protein phosphatase [Podospora fimiseda]